MATPRRKIALSALVTALLGALLLLAAPPDSNASQRPLKSVTVTPSKKGKRVLVFKVRVQPDRLGRARVKLKGKVRGKRYRRVKLSRVRHAARAHGLLRLHKPRRARTGKLKLRVERPEADPGPGGDLSVGNLIAADDASSSPIPLWHEFCALSLSSSTQERLAARHSYHAGGGPHDGPYRELSYQDGDDCYNERTELGANSQRPSETFQVYREGDRKLTEGWFRFPDSYNGRGGGWQMKQAATGSNSSHYAEPPVLRLEMVESRWVLRHSVDRNPITLWQSEPNPRQEWLHMALDVTYSQDPSEGRIVVYEGSDAKPLSKVAEITGYATLLTEENTGAATPQGGAMPSHLRAGIYQRLAYGDNTMDLGPTRVYGIR